MSYLLFLYPATGRISGANAVRGSWANPIHINGIADKILDITRDWKPAFEGKMNVEVMDTEAGRIEACSFRLSKDAKSQTWIDQITTHSPTGATPGELVEGHTLYQALHNMLHQGAAFDHLQDLYDAALVAFETNACKSTYDMRAGVNAVVNLVLASVEKES